MKFWGIRLISIVLAFAFCFGLDAVSSHFNDYIVRLVVLCGLYVTLSVSLNMINGLTGQFSIGHAAFYAIGAYTGGYATVLFFHKAHLPGMIWLLITMAIGAVAAAIAGFVVGLPSLRLRGDYLAIVTLGFGEIVRIAIQNTNEFGGAYGLQIDVKVQSVWMVWMLAIVCIAVSRNLIKTARGLLFLSVREDEIAAAAMGVRVTSVKLTAFVLGSAFAGMAGAILMHYEGFVTPLTFDMSVSFIILTMVVLGGTGSITGSIVSAIVLTLLPEMLRNFKDAHGNGLSLPASTVVAMAIALVVAVAIIKRVIDRGIGTLWQRSLKYLGAAVIAAIAEPICSFLLGMIPALHSKMIAVEQLRMTVFAVALIVLMLLRPQGLFAHHEFSWTWVRKLFTRSPRTPSTSPPASNLPETAVAS